MCIIAGVLEISNIRFTVSAEQYVGMVCSGGGSLQKKSLGLGIISKELVQSREYVNDTEVYVWVGKNNNTNTCAVIYEFDCYYNMCFSQ